MSLTLTVTQNVTELNLTVTQNGNSTTVKPTITQEASVTADEKVKVSANDTTAGYLNGKLVAGANIILQENNDGDNETLEIIASSVGGSLTAYKTTTETKNNDTTLAIDADMQIALETDSWYLIRVSGIQNAASTPDFKLSVDFSGTSDYGKWMFDWDSQAAFLYDLGTSVNSAGNSNDRGFNLVGWVKTSSTGNVGLYWAQNTSSALNTKLLEGSFIEAIKMN